MLDDALQLADLEAAADLLVVEDDVARVSVLGFCMGGYYTYKAAAVGSLRRGGRVLRHVAHARELARRRPRRDPLDLAAEMCPTLAIFGSDDPYTPAGRHRRAARRVERPGRLRDRRDRRCRSRLRPRPRPPGAPRRRCRRALVASRSRWMAPCTVATPVAAQLRARSVSSSRSRMRYWPRPETSSQPSRTNVAIALFTRFARRADHPRELLLGQRHAELVLAARQLEQPLRGAPGDVEEHGVGERLVGRAEPPGEDRDDGPQQFGLRG